MAALSGVLKSSQGIGPSGQDTGLAALPQELQIRCVEFLALGDAASLAKQLSKGTRAARYAPSPAAAGAPSARWRETARRPSKASWSVILKEMTIHRRARGPGRSDWPACPDASRALFRGGLGARAGRGPLQINLWTRESYHEAYLFLCLVERSPMACAASLAACYHSHREARAAPATAAGPRSPKMPTNGSASPASSWALGCGALSAALFPPAADPVRRTPGVLGGPGAGGGLRLGQQP